MSETPDLTTLQALDDEIAKTIRKLGWLQTLRDERIDYRRNGPRTPKGPQPRGTIRLARRALSNTEQNIVNVCRSYPNDEWRTQELLDETQMKKATLSCALTALVRDGYVHRVGKGRYQLNPEVR